MHKVSVIIPVYNVEKYLSRCLDSVTSQTYQNLEIICINDGSTDSSRQILEQYQKLDNRIVIYNKDKHLCAAASRNFGMDVATGKYIIFVDSDDYVASVMIEKMVAHIEKTNAEVVTFDYFARNFRQWESNNRYTYRWHFDCNEVIQIDKENPINYFFLTVPCWNKIFTAEFLKRKNLRFPDYPIYEDLVFWADVYLNAEKLYYAPEAYYFYRRKRKGSLMQKRDDNLLYVVDIHKKAAELFKQHNMYDKMKTVLDYIMIRDFCIKMFCVGEPYNRKLFNKIKECNFDVDCSKFDELDLSDESKEYIKYFEILKESNFDEFYEKTKEHVPIDA